MRKRAIFLYMLFLVQYSLFSQNVGIGTTTPQGILHLKGTNWVKTIFENNTGETRGYIGADNNGTITLASNAYWDGSNWQYPNTGSSMYLLLHRVNNRYEFRVRPEGGSQAIAMTIDTGSNAGIGGGLIIDQENGNSGVLNNNSLRFGNLSGEGIGSKRNAGTGQYGIDFYTNSTNRMMIANNGNVGIGTTNPQAKLDVNGDVNIENRLLLNNSAGNNGQALVSNGTGAAPSWRDLAYGNTDRFLFVTSNENFVRNTDTLFFDVRYAGSAALSYNNGVFTINKSGFYKLEGSFTPISSITNVNTYCYYTLYGDFSGTTGAITFYSNHMTRLNSDYGLHVQISQSIYLASGTQFLFLPSFVAGSAFNFKRHMYSTPLSIYLISE